jgi:hypothetical protein
VPAVKTREEREEKRELLLAHIGAQFGGEEDSAKEYCVVGVDLDTPMGRWLTGGDDGVLFRASTRLND